MVSDLMKDCFVPSERSPKREDVCEADLEMCSAKLAVNFKSGGPNTSSCTTFFMESPRRFVSQAREVKN